MPVDSVLAAEGVVQFNRSGCRDRFLVQTTLGWAILEWFGGNDPGEGHVLVGDFEQFGMKDIYNATARAQLRVWVEDYWLSQNRAVDKMREFCR